jgi:uncharacterized protein YqjF (DUF2071 family)
VADITVRREICRGKRRRGRVEAAGELRRLQGRGRERLGGRETRGRPMTRPFLTARWEDLVFLNYVCPRKILDPLVPAGTELDLWEGEALVSLVGLMFRDTRVRGVAIPGHRAFEEVNLRFYVRRETPDDEMRRAVVFVREVVPRRAVAAVARWVYNEPYAVAAMSHRVELDPTSGGEIEYEWRTRTGAFAIAADASGPATPAPPGSEAEFVTEHYWGYTRQRDGGTLEYQVDHPVWSGWSASGLYRGTTASLYGAAFEGVLRETPRSAFIALGSEVTVHRGERLRAEAAG